MVDYQAMREQSQSSRFFQELLTEYDLTRRLKDETWRAVAARAGISATQLALLKRGEHNPGEAIQRRVLAGLAPEIETFLKKRKEWAEYVRAKRREFKFPPPGGGSLRVAK